jgi:hypothetical protein
VRKPFRESAVSGGFEKISPFQGEPHRSFGQIDFVEQQEELKFS